MKTMNQATKHDWTRFDAMNGADRHAAAIGDPDPQPLTLEDMQRMRQTLWVRIIRRALGLSQQEFADRFRIPIGTLRNWEQGRQDPDAAARAYLMVLAATLLPFRKPCILRRSRLTGVLRKARLGSLANGTSPSSS